MDLVMPADFGTLRESMENAIENFNTALKLNSSKPEDSRPRTTAFARGMGFLVGVQVGLARGDARSEIEMSEFRRNIVILVKSITLGGFFAYVADSLYSAICSIDDGWYDPCSRRSALELFRGDYPGAEELIVSDADITDSLAEMEEYLRDRAQYVDPLPEEQIPPGLPDSHWWWRLPAHAGE